MPATAPRNRQGFDIAIICALRVEEDAVHKVLDKFWDDDGHDYGKAANDPNEYTTGAIGQHNVVVVRLAGKGGREAAAAAGNFRHSFPNTRLAIIVGICGGVPKAKENGIFLGDIVISNAAIQYDLRKQHEGRSERISDPIANLSRQRPEVLHLVTKFDSERYQEKLQTEIKRELTQLRLAHGSRVPPYPGATKDQLFDPAFIHKHTTAGECATCDANPGQSCETALETKCQELGCDKSNKIVKRERPDHYDDRASDYVPGIHVGPVGCGDTVMKSATDRDETARRENVIAFEMEGTGVWDQCPSIILKAVCDYADSHKNKEWQKYAAIMAAVGMKALLKYWNVPLGQTSPIQSCFLVPFGKNENFVGREAVLQQVLERIPPAAHPDTCQRTVVEGLGGIGKTQIVIEAAHRFHAAYPECSVFWVPTVDKTTFENAYREIGRALGVNALDDDKADVILLVREALSQDDASPWLLILDNADHSHLLLPTEGPESMQLRFDQTKLTSYLPASRKGSILITTRNHQAAVGFQPRQGLVKIDTLDYCDSIRLLHQGLQPSQIGDPYCAKQLLDCLAHLPLAIRQAAAYMALKSNISMSTYLDYCRSSDQTLIKMLSKDFEDQDRYEGIQNPIATTWLISFRQILQEDPLAAEYLQFSSYMAEKDVPISLLPAGQDEIERDEAIGTLAAYAFITQREFPGTTSDRFDLHRLVRIVMRNWLRGRGGEEKQVTSAVRELAEKLDWPAHEKRQIWVGYLPHTQAVLFFGEQCGDKTALLRILSYTREGNDMLGRYADAEPFGRMAVEVAREAFNEEHPSTLNSMNNLALVLGSQGKYEEAERMHRHTLQWREKTLGEEHPSTLISMDNLASVLSSQGKYEEAERMHRHTLQRMEKALGEEHPDTLSSMNNLALVLGSQGKYEEAERMHWQTLQWSKKTLGAEHPSTLTSMNNLALVLGSQGKYEEAERMHRHTLQRREKTLGEEHPSTLGSMNNLAGVLSSQGRYEEAERMHRHTLQWREKTLGAEHPDTLASMSNLASVLDSQGKYEEAERMHRHTLQRREKTLGEEHPSTLSSMNNLALVLSSQGKYEEAERMHWQTLQRREEAFGTEHPDTLSSMNNLALVLGSQGKYEEAERMHWQTLQRREEAFGTEHPSTLNSMNNLALVLGSQGKYEEAERMHRHTLQRREKTLGEEHPSTLSSMNNLASVLGSQGKYEEAERMHRHTLQRREKTLGEEHPSTLGSMNNLAGVLSSQGRYEEAERMHRHTLQRREKTLGAEHPDTLASMSNLASVLDSQGKYEEAERII